MAEDIKEVKETKTLSVQIDTEILDAFREKVKNDFNKEVSQHQVVQLLLEGWTKEIYKIETKTSITLSLPQ